MKPTLNIRIWAASYRKVRRVFPAEKDESAASYFDRLTKFLEQLHADGKLYFL